MKRWIKVVFVRLRKDTINADGTGQQFIAKWGLD
jgi:hypothetical protein